MSYVQQLEQRITTLQSSGVVDIKLFTPMASASDESIAKGILDLMDAPIVDDVSLI